MIGGAIISPCGAYRYLLERRWLSVNSSHRYGERACFVMLNPSTANADEDDPTIRKCVGFAGRWGCSEIDVVNLFGVRSTDPSVLLRGGEIVGHDNDQHVADAVAKASVVVAAWGAHAKPFAMRRKVIERMLPRNTMCLGRTKDGSPRHPLMLAYATPLQPYFGVE